MSSSKKTKPKDKDKKKKEKEETTQKLNFSGNVTDHIIL